MNKGCLLLIAVVVLFMGCKKEALTHEEWQELATAKLNEIEALVATIPCSQQDEAVIEGVQQYCGKTYYPVTASIQAKFNQLRSAYEQLSRRQWDAFVNQGGVIDCFGGAAQPIRIGCEDNKLLVYTVYNLPMDEAREMAANLHANIQHYQDTVSCSDNQQWGFTVVQHLASDKLEVLPVRHDVGNAEWWGAMSDYQVLVRRLRLAAGNESYPGLDRDRKPTGVVCVDGKPVIEYQAE